MKEIVTFKGKSIEQMSRDELIEALTWCANELEALQIRNSKERDFLFSIINPSHPRSLLQTITNKITGNE